jgi:LEA14-like dessication related protein
MGNNEQLIVYPNPAANMVQVAWVGNSGQITVFDVLGKEVPIPNPFQRKGDSTTIDVSTLQEGVYFINVKTSEGVATKKIIVQH